LSDNEPIGKSFFASNMKAASFRPASPWGVVRRSEFQRPAKLVVGFHQSGVPKLDGFCGPGSADQFRRFLPHPGFDERAGKLEIQKTGGDVKFQEYRSFNQYWNSLTGSRFGSACHSVRAAQWVGRGY
jgi:hypothetical protein